MKRREFLRYSVAAAVTIPGIISLSGCGGGGGGGSTPASLNSADTQVSLISSEQSKNDALHTESSSSSNSLLTQSSTQAGAMLTSAALLTQPSDLFSKFQKNELKLKPASDGIYFDSSTLWKNYLDSHTLAYEQSRAQLDKLKASLRLYGYKQKTGVQSGAIQASVALTGNSVVDGMLTELNTIIVNVLKGDITAAAMDALRLSFEAVNLGLKTLLTNDLAKKFAYTTLMYLGIEKVMKYVQEKSTSSLSFTTNTDVMVSIAKLTVAVISALSIASIEKLNTASNTQASATTTSLSTEEQQQLNAFLQASSLQSQMILTLTELTKNVMNSVSNATQAKVNALAAITASDTSYVLSDEDHALIASLKQQSLILGALGLVMKVLLNFYQAGLSGVNVSDTLQADAETFAFLFSDTDNVQNPITQFSLSQLLSDLAALNFAPLSSVTPTTPTASSGFASDTAALAANFTTHMADLAYQFTMKIEDDAYTFAMKGMEYGYLFASRGEEVGLMADRILWMAVQIGVMADRIGEMADRIVYTEQLIVYTEMLILDFGLLIYGGMKQISNVMLMGMAIVFDRQWYANATTTDPILTIISTMTKQMLTNMQEYELAVIANQKTLRETTMKALDWIKGEY